MSHDGKPTNVYLLHETRKRLDARCAEWGRIARGQAIHRLLDIADEHAALVKKYERLLKERGDR